MAENEERVLVPDDLKRFNLGAFCFGFFWFLAHWVRFQRENMQVAVSCGFFVVPLFILIMASRHPLTYLFYCFCAVVFLIFVSCPGIPLMYFILLGIFSVFSVGSIYMERLYLLQYAVLYEVPFIARIILFAFLCVPLFFGFRGNRILIDNMPGWKKKYVRHGEVAALKTSQRGWKIVGFIYLILSMVATMLFIEIMPHMGSINGKKRYDFNRCKQYVWIAGWHQAKSFSENGERPRDRFGYPGSRVYQCNDSRDHYCFNHLRSDLDLDPTCGESSSTLKVSHDERGTVTEITWSTGIKGITCLLCATDTRHSDYSFEECLVRQWDVCHLDEEEFRKKKKKEKKSAGIIDGYIWVY